MEMTGVAEAAQFINVSINGTETILKLTGSFVHFTGHEIKELLLLLMAKHKENTHNKELKPGEVKISDLMKECNKNKEQLGVIQMDERITDEFVKYCKDNKLSYSFLYDANKTDTFCEAVYRGGQTAAFEPFLASRYPLARPYSLEEYKQNATVEGFAKAEAIVKECEKQMVPVEIDQKQITGVNDEHVEVMLSDNDNKESFVLFPKDRVRFKDEQIVLSVADSDFIDAYDKSAFEKNAAGKVVMVPDNGRRNLGKVGGENLREMARMEYARCLSGKHQSKGTTIVNSKTKDVLPKTRGAVISFPTKKR